MWHSKAQNSHLPRPGPGPGPSQQCCPTRGHDVEGWGRKREKEERAAREGNRDMKPGTAATGRSLTLHKGKIRLHTQHDCKKGYVYTEK